MRAFTIRRKLVLITMSTCMVAVAIACGMFAIYEVVMVRRAMVIELSMQADLLAVTSVAALAFDDASAAAEGLAALANDTDVVRGILYGKDGRMFSAYRRAGAELAIPAPNPTDTYAFSRDRLAMWRRLVFRGEDAGTLFLENDLSELRSRLHGYAGIVAIVMLATGLVAFVLASRLQRSISEPIGELVSTANVVSADHDYSLRVPNRRHDEIGELIDGFNGMLGQVEARDLALMRGRDELEDRVDERTTKLRVEIAEREQAQAELEHAKDVAESATRAKSTFLASMSHEIRTPINVIIGMTDMALDGTLPIEARDYLGTSRRATLALLAIVNDILDSAKIESGKITLETVDVSLQSLLAETVDLLHGQARAKGLTLTYTIGDGLPAVVHADPGRVKQVLMNLIGNALKFTETGGVVVGFELLGRSATDVRIRGTVRDTGIGIPLDRRDAIFESFTQADESTTRTYGGTGLGLTICQQLVGLMGGRIGVESEPGHGSTFWFEISVRLASPELTAANGGAADPEPEPISALRVLNQ